MQDNHDDETRRSMAGAAWVVILAGLSLLIIGAAVWFFVLPAIQ